MSSTSTSSTTSTSMDVEKEKPVTDQAKEQVSEGTDKAKQTYKENMPEALGGRPETVVEKAEKMGEGHVKEMEGEEAKQNEKSIIGQLKALYVENMPTAFGGRPATATEKAQDKLEEGKVKGESALDEGKEKLEKGKEKLEAEKEKSEGSNESLLHQAKVAYRENMPEILGGRPATFTEKGREKLEDFRDGVDKQVDAHQEAWEAKEPKEDQSLSDKVKHGYRENMPEALGGRPETTSEKLQDKVDNIKSEMQEKVDNIKEGYEQGTLGEQAKEAYRENMPEAMGGREPTAMEKVKGEVQQGKKQLKKKIAKDRAGKRIEGRKEQIENATS